MKKSSIITAFASGVGILVLILDTKTALSGAGEGLELCIRTIIPSLFPFFILSILLTGHLTGVQVPFLRPLGRLMGIPEGTESILISGFLGGYPVGAQAVGAALSSKQLSPAEARRMLAFCNNAGPAFLFGIAGALFPSPWMGWALWGIHIFSAVGVSLLLPCRSQRCADPACAHPPTLTEAMTRAVGVMGQVCGWVILFRVVIAFFGRWFGWLLPSTGQIILSGLLELSNGCCGLVDMENTGFRFVLCSGFLAFGGLCVAAQTMSVAQGVDKTLYFPGKILQTLLSLALSTLIQRVFSPEMRWEIPPAVPLFLAAAALFPFFVVKIRNRGRNSALVGV